MLPSLGATQQVTYHRVAPKIYVPFDPNTAKVLHQSARLFTIEVPMRGIESAFSPKTAPFGDTIAFVSGLSTFAFTSVFLEPVRVLRSPQDVASAPEEVKEFWGERNSGAEVSRVSPLTGRCARSLSPAISRYATQNKRKQKSV
ncbi:MAG: hypothetical protein ACK40X_14565, partial [Armatimonadota bacterium]